MVWVSAVKFLRRRRGGLKHTCKEDFFDPERGGLSFIVAAACIFSQSTFGLVVYLKQQILMVWELA